MTSTTRFEHNTAVCRFYFNFYLFTSVASKNKNTTKVENTRVRWVKRYNRYNSFQPSRNHKPQNVYQTLDG